jgi:2-iminoacetate synthase ThiH
MECRREFRGKEIIAKIEPLEHGISVLLTGGDLPHVGAVSVADPQDGVHTIALCGHKDQYIGEVWARELCEKTKLPVSVTAGIHYDQITKAEIEEIQALAQEMLEEVLEALHG